MECLKFYTLGLGMAMVLSADEGHMRQGEGQQEASPLLQFKCLCSPIAPPSALSPCLAGSQDMLLS